MAGILDMMRRLNDDRDADARLTQLIGRVCGILDTMRRLNAAADRGAMVSVADLRAAGLTDLDARLTRLIQRGTLTGLHYDPNCFPGVYPEDKGYLQIGTRWYCGVSIRQFWTL